MTSTGTQKKSMISQFHSHVLSFSIMPGNAKLRWRSALTDDLLLFSRFRLLRLGLLFWLLLLLLGLRLRRLFGISHGVIGERRWWQDGKILHDLSSMFNHSSIVTIDSLWVHCILGYIVLSAAVIYRYR